MIIHRFSNGDTIERQKTVLIAHFAGKRKVLSTAAYNGGMLEDLKCVFNYDCSEECGVVCDMKAPTYEEHMKLTAIELGLCPESSAGLSTTAFMKNASIKSETYKDTTVTAVATAGIDINGGRVGDPAMWHETDGDFESVCGTINIMLFIEANLDDGALTRVLVTATEAKTAALQELLASSRYSSGIATGSGTDGTIVVCDTSSKVKLTWAGKHSKLGELIGRTVMAAVKEALFLQTGMCAERQHSILRRMDRFGVTEETLRKTAMQNGSDVSGFAQKLSRIDKDNNLVTYTSLYAHLLDQLSWGMISAEEALTAAQELLRLLNMCVAIQSSARDNSGSIEALIQVYIIGLCGLITESK